MSTSHDESARRLRILVIEDSDESRETLRLMFEVWGYDVASAPDGARGVALAMTWRPHAALIDLALPEIDGYEVARTLRSHLGSAIHLIALSGSAGAEVERHCTEAGFDSHFLKPVEPETLRTVLQRRGFHPHPE